ncbi:hypothetical protein ACH5RR_009212 [Cinchona calisaya]|uniref:Reverse transcriptase zinc-binding domain-containing protein n=1 Tax=Cinchona calisaya TaxID=153742 RepID=A0ABD3AH89_9GENT
MDQSPGKQIILVKYCNNSCLDRAKGSYPWRSLRGTSNFLMQKVKWKLGDGTLEKDIVTDRRWEIIWKGQGPNRFNHLLWLIRHEKLMTSNLKKLVTLVKDDLCPVCAQSTETTLLEIWDCVWSKSCFIIWSDAHCPLVFRVAVAHNWDWRNKCVHQNSILTTAKHVKIIHSKASSGNPRAAAYGGLVRNDQGKWLFGFAVNIGTTKSLVAELWGIWKKGHRAGVGLGLLACRNGVLARI